MRIKLNGKKHEVTADRSCVNGNIVVATSLENETQYVLLVATIENGIKYHTHSSWVTAAGCVGDKIIIVDKLDRIFKLDPVTNETEEIVKLSVTATISQVTSVGDQMMLMFKSINGKKFLELVTNEAGDVVLKDINRSRYERFYNRAIYMHKFLSQRNITVELEEGEVYED